MVTTTNPTNRGDSGGPLFDKHGHLVAVTESGKPGENLVNFFVDVTEVRGLLGEKKIQIKELSDEPDPKGTDIAGKKDPKKDTPSTTTSTDTATTTPEKKSGDTAATTPEKKSGDSAATTPEKKNGDAAAPSPADEKAAADLLNRSKIFANDPDNQEYYKGRLREIVKKYPGTEAAKEAQKKLDALK
jgi:hypothetical protein